MMDKSYGYIIYFVVRENEFTNIAMGLQNYRNNAIHG